MKEEFPDSFAKLVERWFAGDQEAADEVISSVDKDLKKIAHTYARRSPISDQIDSEQIVIDVYVTLIEKRPHIETRSHFMALCAAITRRLLLDQARKRLSLRNNINTSDLRSAQTGGEKMQVDIVAVHEALERLEQVDARRARIVELRYFGGLSTNEIAAWLNISRAAVEYHWSAARVWLRGELAVGSDLVSHTQINKGAVFGEPKEINKGSLFIESPPLFLDPEEINREMSDEEFFEFCEQHKDLRIERTKEGELVIMPPTGGEAGIRNAKLIARVSMWAERDKSGQVFDSSTGFTLPNRSVRSPDLSWLRNDRWEALSSEEQERFPPLVPDFVVEIRSRTDSLVALQAKMVEYVENGAQLGWLIDPFERKVHIYRAHASAKVLDDPETLSGEPLLKDFVLDVRALWE